MNRPTGGSPPSPCQVIRQHSHSFGIRQTPRPRRSASLVVPFEACPCVDAVVEISFDVDGNHTVWTGQSGRLVVLGDGNRLSTRRVP